MRKEAARPQTITVVYTIDEDKRLIVIAAIYHHKGNPKKKYRDI